MKKSSFTLIISISLLLINKFHVSGQEARKECDVTWYYNVMGSSAVDIFQTTKNDYVTFAPTIIRPGMGYSIATVVFNPDWVEAKFLYELIDSTNTALARNEQFYVPGALKVTELQIPARLDPTQYYDLRVSVKGAKVSTNIFEKRRLLVSPVTASLLIQLDKPIYKAEDVVGIRVIAILPDLTPLTGPVNVYALDPLGHRVAQWLSQKPDEGVVTLELPLGLYPLNGGWKIGAELVGQKGVEKGFEVSCIQLPIFEVRIDTLPFQVVSQDITGTIEATYTFGEPVHSFGTLKLSFDNNTACQGKNYVQQIKLPDGYLEFKIPFDVIEKICPGESSLVGILLLEAKVMDEASRTEAVGLAPTKLFTKPINVQFSPSNPISFKPNLPYIGYVKVTQPDGLPLREYTEGITVRASGTSAVADSFFTKSYAIDKEGNVAFEVPVPPDLISLYIFAELEVSKVSALTHIKDVQQSNTNSFISLSLVTTEPKAGQVAEFDVKSTNPVEEIYYLVLSKGSIVHSGCVSMGGKSFGKLHLTMTKGMAPLARVVAFFTKDSELIVDGLNFRVSGIFRNEVEALFLKPQLGPGAEAELVVSTGGDSLVCVLSLDKRLAIYSQLYDFTVRDVIQSLAQFDTTKSGFKLIEERGGAMSVSVGGTDALTIIDQSGLNVFTDADLETTRSGKGKCDEARDCTFEPFVSQGELLEELGHVRKFFPDTWMWKCQKTTPTGEVTFKEMTADHLTYWVTSVFALHPKLGLGMLPAPIELRVFKIFFAFIKIPTHVILGETIMVKVVVFNYSPGTIRSIKAGGSGVIHFPIKPTQLGLLEIVINAQAGTSYTDSVQRTLEVRAPGLNVRVAGTLFLDLKRFSTCNKRQSYRFTHPYPIPIVPGIVASTLRIDVSVSGDILGPAMHGLMDDKFLQFMPHGCAEQNLIYFGPLVYTYRYLLATKQLENWYRVKAKTTMQKAYMNELGFQRTDGSFATFPPSTTPNTEVAGDGTPLPPNPQNAPSTWLTAFIVKLFKQATPFVYIDQIVVESALNWLITKQHPAGYFREEGKLLLNAIQGNDVTNPYSLTAFVVIALVESKNYSKELPALSDALSAAINFIEVNFDIITKDVYKLSITCYALALSKSSKVTRCLDTGHTFANQTNEHLYWVKAESGRQSIETSAYFLLSYLHLKQMDKAIKVARWLIAQQDEYGSFHSTQDTVIALQALSLYSEMTFCPDPVFTVNVALGEDKFPFKVTRSNGLLYQTVSLPIRTQDYNSLPKDISIDAVGQGVGLIQIVLNYNVAETEVRDKRILITKDVTKEMAQPIITKVDPGSSIATTSSAPTSTVLTKLSPPTTTTSTQVTTKGGTNHGGGGKVKETLPFTLLIVTVASKYDLGVKACTRWNLNKPKDSGFTTLEMGTPTGFRADIESVNLLDDLASVKEEKEKLVFYLNKVEGKQMCITYKLKRVDLVGQQQAVPCKIYQYYNPDTAVVKFLDAVTERLKSVCDLCKTNCEDTCPDIKRDGEGGKLDNATIATTF